MCKLLYMAVTGYTPATTLSGNVMDTIKQLSWHGLYTDVHQCYVEELVALW